MNITKDQLDTPICEFIKGAKNTETPREFIRNTELEFNLNPADLDELDDSALNFYIEILDDFWNK